MSLYHPNKRGHLALRHLARSPDTFTGIADALTYDGRTDRRKVWLVTKALVHDDLIETGAHGYEITAAGREALRRMDAGEAFSAEAPAPTVRVFARKAVAA